MKTSENKPKNAPKTLAKVLAVCSTAFIFSMSFMGNTYPVGDEVAVRPTATITDNVLGYATPFPLEYSLDRIDGTQYYNDDGNYEVEIFDSPLSFTLSVYGNRSVLENTLLTYEFEDFVLPMELASIFRGTFSITSQEQYFQYVTFDYLYLDENGENRGSGDGSSIDFIGPYVQPFYSPNADMEYIFIEYLRIDFSIDTSRVLQPADVTLSYSDGVGYNYHVTAEQYNAIYGDFLNSQGITVANPVDLLWSPIRNFLTTEIFPGFNIGTVLSIGIGLLCFGMFLKIFVGG